MAILLLFIGLASIITQVLTLRELVNVFNGNELTYGIALMLWLVSGGIGSYIAGKTLSKIKNPLQILLFTVYAISILIPIEILCARMSKFLFGIPSGILPDLNLVLLISIISVFPVSSLFGFVFTLGSKVLTDIGKMYFLESLGAVLGGVLFSFILVYILNPFQIAGLTGVLLCGLSLHIYKYQVRSTVEYKLLFFLIISFILAVNIILIFPSGRKIDHYTSKLIYKGLQLVRSVDSEFGRIAVIKDKDTLSYFENGGLMFSTASVAENEEIAHLPFLEVQNPKNILLIGGGLGGVLEEIQKHKTDELDYVEFDPKLVELARSQFPVIVTDGRLYLKNTTTKYDLIIVNLPDPNTASLNRFYTLEFFKLCKEKLSPGGVLTLHLSTSTVFMKKELIALNSSILKTLKAVFPEVIVIPGNYNYFFASGVKGYLTDNASTLLSRWQEQDIKTSYFNAHSIPYIVQPDKIKYVNRTLEENAQVKLNTDFDPISYIYSILIWLSYFPGTFSSPLQKILNVKLAGLMIFIAGLAAAYKIAASRSKRSLTWNIPVITSLTGFCAMALQLTLIYTFEALYGHIYNKIGLLIAIFMGGLACGSYLTNSIYRSIKLEILLLLLLAANIFFWVFLFAAPGINYMIAGDLILLFSFVFALLVGTIFPIAVRRYQARTIENKAGVLYGVDLLGGSVSALMTSLLFIPLYGISGTCALLIFISFVSVALAYRSS